MYNNGKVSSELFAVVNIDGDVVWTRGGSSSSPKLMVYESEKKTERALNNMWTKQVHDSDSEELEIKQIYPTK